MAIANPQTTKSSDALDKHVRQDEIESNNHYPKGFLNASAGETNWKAGDLEHTWEAMQTLPPALSLRDVMAAAPVSPSDGDTYLLDHNGDTYTVSAINWQSGTTVRYTFSGTPDLSSISATNVLVSTGAVNSEHNGAFVITTVNDGSDFIEVTNALVTDATLDETTGATVTTPHGDWSGAEANSWVRYNSADGVWYAVPATLGQCCIDLTLASLRCYNGTRWIGEFQPITIALSDESTDLTTGTAKVTFRMPFKYLITGARINVNTAPVGSTIEVDINTSGASILTTVYSIDASEETSLTAATPGVIDTAKEEILNDEEVTFDIDQVGSTTAGKGLKITLLGVRI